MAHGLIFDLDGTLIDSLPGIAASLNHGLLEEGLPPHPLERVRGFIGNGSLELARRALPPEQPDTIAHRIEAAFKIHYQDTWPLGTHPYPGIPGILKELAAAGFRLAVLSNKPHLFTVEIAARLFPGIPFDPVRGQKDGVPRKPDPAAALAIAASWSLPPAECLFIGDSTVDLETARRAGIPFLAVSWGYHDASDLLAAGAKSPVARISGLPAAISVF